MDYGSWLLLFLFVSKLIWHVCWWSVLLLCLSRQIIYHFLCVKIRLSLGGINDIFLWSMISVFSQIFMLMLSDCYHNDLFHCKYWWELLFLYKFFLSIMKMLFFALFLVRVILFSVCCCWEVGLWNVYWILWFSLSIILLGSCKNLFL